MDIFESLENLEISEECFNDIMDIVEEILSESTDEYIKRKKLDPIHNMGVKMVKNAVPTKDSKRYNIVNIEGDKEAIEKDPDKFYNRASRPYSDIIFGKNDSKYGGFRGYDRNAEVMDAVGKGTNSKALQKAAEKTLKYSGMLNKARLLRNMNTDDSKVETKAEKGEKKTRDRRYETEDVIDHTGCGEYEVTYHKGEEKGYTRNPKSQEQRTKEKLEKKRKINNS